MEGANTFEMCCWPRPLVEAICLWLPGLPFWQACHQNLISLPCGWPVKRVAGGSVGCQLSCIPFLLFAIGVKELGTM
eukprot:6479803-Amphidinium_carterae.1